MRIKFLGGDHRKGEFTVDPLAELCSCLVTVVVGQGRVPTIRMTDPMSIKLW